MGGHHHHGSTKNIKTAFFLNLSFTILEIIGGLYINSVAILSDAIHDLGDSLSLGLSWYLDKYSKKEGNNKYSYGYKRYSLLAAMINTIVLFIGSFLVLSETIPRLINPEPSNAKGMIIFAIIGIIVNGLAVFNLKGGVSLNEKVVSWHLLEDVLGWIAVLIAGIVMYFIDIPILDPILSIGISIFILYNVIKNFRKTLDVFLQAVPEGIDLEDINEKFIKIDKVISTHHTHVWSLDSEHHVLTTHLVVNPDISIDDMNILKTKARESIQDLDIEHVTIEIETSKEFCSIKDNN